jgi:hypothetical protein
MQIMVELRPLLRQYTVYPKFVDNPGIENGKQHRPGHHTASQCPPPPPALRCTDNTAQAD